MSAVLPLLNTGAPDVGAVAVTDVAPVSVLGADPQPVQVLYIAGYGRSGTTLLDIALGTHPAVMGGGEIATLARHVWVNAEYCACGSTVSNCPLWSDVVADWCDGESPTLIDEYRRAQERTETISGLGRALEAGRAGNHAARTAKLFQRIAARSGRRIIVDSSKLPGRGFALAANPGIDLYVVHVVRDARGVAWSLKKGFARHVEKGLQRTLRPKPLLYSALRWSIVNLATERLCRRVGPRRSVRVRYEDFVADPQGTLARILAMVGERPAPDAASGAFAPQHQVAGSRHRMQSTITIAKDERWKATMPRPQLRLVSMLTGPLLRRYGYALRPYAGEDGQS